MWIKRLFGIGGGADGADNDKDRSPVVLRDVGEAIVVTVACDKCGEHIEIRLRKSSDIGKTFGESDYERFVQKTIVGKKCFNRIELRLEMDDRHRLMRSDVKGGSLVEPGRSGAN